MPYWQNIALAFSSTSPNQLTSSIAIGTPNFLSIWQCTFIKKYIKGPLAREKDANVRTTHRTSSVLYLLGNTMSMCEQPTELAVFYISSETRRQCVNNPQNYQCFTSAISVLWRKLSSCNWSQMNPCDGMTYLRQQGWLARWGTLKAGRVTVIWNMR